MGVSESEINSNSHQVKSLSETPAHFKGMPED